MTVLSSGTHIAGFRVVRLLGQGSSGTVYLAEDLSLERRVALKLLAPELARDARFRERFLRESRLAASLDHPNIVPIHAAGEADGALFIAMRYVDGQDLGELLEARGPPAPERAVEIVGQVAAALDAAHAGGLVHRDVKPGNILIAATGEHAYLCDFGLAKHASTAGSLTGERAFVGTMAYIAPEQIEGARVDGRADVYALGCVLYECLTGMAPFARENELAVLHAHLATPPPRVTATRPELPDGIDDVVAGAMAKDPDDRYQRASELAAAARAALAGHEPALPAGARASAPAVRTFMFADLRGYTRFTRERGDEAAGRLASRFAEIVEVVVRQHGGVLQELRGDEALLVFHSAREALRCAVDLQRRIAEEELELGAGMGLDAGEAVPAQEGYRGSALNLAARLCSLAAPGEVLVSEGLMHLARETPGVRYGEQRLERVKGFDRPVRVIEVLPEEATPARRLGRKVRRALAGTRPRLRLALALVALAVAAVAIGVSRGGDAGAEPVAFEKGTIGLLDARTLEPVGAFQALGAPGGMWRDEAGQVWTIDIAARLAARIDPERRQVTARIPLGINPGWAAVGAGSFWLGDYDAAAVNRYDPDYGSRTARIRLPTDGLEGDAARTEGMAFADGSLWVAYGGWPFRVARIDARTNRVTKTFDLPRADSTGLVAYGEGGLWVAARDTGRMWRIDPQTNTVAATAQLHGGFVEDLVVARGYAWAPLESDRGVWKVDSGGSVLTKIETGDLPWSISAADGRLWVPNANAGTITRIDRNDESRTARVGHRPVSAVEAGGLVWVSLEESAADAVQGLDPQSTARGVVEGNPYFNIDPAVSFPGGGWQLQNAVGARLLRFPDKEEPAGVTLAPEISELPEVSPDGRTYTFRIKPGFRFSPPSGKPVDAETMRYTIERALSPKLDSGAQGFTFVSDIVGAQAFHDGEAADIEGLRVDGDSLRITLERPAPSFPTRISAPFFTAVPLGTPIFRHGVDRPIPSPGPYYLSSSIAGTQLVLRRNPNYGGPRPRRLEAIVIAQSVPGEAGAKRVERGEADFTFSERLPLPAELALGGSLDRRFGAGSAAAKEGKQRFFLPRLGAMELVRFNTFRGIFRDARLRRAVNYALDRPALAGASGSRPSDALLVPGVPGAGGEALYPLDGPDLDRARALARGRGGDALLIYGAEQSCLTGPRCGQVAEILKRDLAQIGIRLRTKGLDDLFAEVGDPRARFDLVLHDWFIDFPDPVNVVNGILDADRSLGYGYPVGRSLYDDARYLERMRAADRLYGDERVSAYRALVGEMMRESPPAAVFSTPAWPAHFFSERVDPRCNVFRPQDKGLVDLAALCLK